MIDLAVVGAGLGGLAAAVYCARAGLGVAVFERGAVAGGFASTWTRGAYTFEASLHAMDAVGPGQANRRVLDELGVASRLRFLRPGEVRVEYWPDGRRLVVPVGREPLLAFVRQTFGCDITALLDLAAATHEAAYKSLDGGHAGAMQASNGRNGTSLLEELVASADARTLLGSIATWQGATADTIVGRQLLLLLHGYHVLGGHGFEGGSSSLVRALVTELEAAGGTLHLGREVTGIEGRRRAEGVRVDGRRVDARHVLANCSPHLLMAGLLPGHPALRDLAARVLRKTASRSMLRLSAGLTRDPGLPYDSVVRGPVGEFSGLAVTARHVLDPRAAPEGGGVVSISTPWPAGAALDPSEKERLTEALVQGAERATGASLAPHMEVSELAHPGTFARYAGVPGGSVFGFPPLVSNGRPLGSETGLPHLWMAGAWVFPGPGQSAALLSGRLAAHRILQACGLPGGVHL